MVSPLRGNIGIRYSYVNATKHDMQSRPWTTQQLNLFLPDQWPLRKQTVYKQATISPFQGTGLCGLKCLTQEQIQTGDLPVKSPWSYPLSPTTPQYAVKVRRHTPWSRGPLSWIPGMWFTLCQFRLSISFAMAQSSHNSEIYNNGVHAQ